VVRFFWKLEEEEREVWVEAAVVVGWRIADGMLLWIMWRGGRNSSSW
jgi:hypothetical protein